MVFLMRKFFSFVKAKGFTLVEVLIAFGVFTLFFTALFAVYRSGMRMFSTGSWKTTKQKQAQKFLTTLKERIEQASRPSIVNPDGTIIRGPAPFSICPVGPNAVASFACATYSGKKVLSFSVCKPDLTLVNSKQGLVFEETLSIVSMPGGVFGLRLSGSRNTNPGIGGDFNGTLAENQLGAGTTQISELSDVTNIAFSWGLATGSSGAEDGAKVASVTITMKHPTQLYDKTQLVQGFQAQVNAEVPIDGKAAPWP